MSAFRHRRALDSSAAKGANRERNCGSFLANIGRFAGCLIFLFCGPSAFSQTLDHFDGGEARWQLGVQNCDAQKLSGRIDLQGGRNGTPAEQLVFAASEGSIAELFYAIEPCAVNDDFRVRLWVRAARPCGPIGVRVRFPNLIDPRTNQATAVIVTGEPFSQVNDWQALNVQDVPRQLRLKQIVLRSQFGSQVDLNEPFIDGIVFNAYQRPGVNQVWFEDLEVLGQIPYKASLDTKRVATPSPISAAGPTPEPVLALNANDAFPAGKLMRILQYNGEPFDWLRALGIDVLLLDRPPTVEQLARASETGMRLIAPAPPYVRNDLNGKLGPVVAWQVGDAVDISDLPIASQRADQIRALPSEWQRPVVLTPLEGWREASVIGDVFIREFPTSLRGLSIGESLAAITQSQTAMGRLRPWVVALELGSPEKLVRQWEAISDPVGAPVMADCAWHDLWVRTAGSLTTAPRGVLFRSHRPLDSGQPADQQRATALRMVCQWLHAIEPVACGTTVGQPIECNLNDYRVYVLHRPEASLLMMLSQGGQPMALRAGEGRSLQLRLPQSLRGVTAFRMSGPTPERLTMTTQGVDEELSVISPDLVECILLVKNPESAKEFLKRWQHITRSVIADRWQLVYEDLTMTRVNWQTIASVFPAGTAPLPLLAASSNSLREAQVAIQSNQWVHASSLLRRADAFQLRANESLLNRLSPPGAEETSIPTLLAPSAVHLHLTWPPALGGGQWEPIEVRGGDFKDLKLLQSMGWTHDRRQEEKTQVELGLVDQLRMAAWPKPGQALRGGYEGTTLRVRSPMITGIGGTWVRIDAVVRTPLGFGGPEEGLLVYDTIGGAELGKLVRGATQSTVVRLFRFVPADQGLQVFFELLGPGEAYIEKLTVDSWRLRQPGPEFRPISNVSP